MIKRFFRVLANLTGAYFLIGVALATLFSMATEFSLDSFLLIVALWPMLIVLWIAFMLSL